MTNLHQLLENCTEQSICLIIGKAEGFSVIQRTPTMVTLICWIFFTILLH